MSERLLALREAKGMNQVDVAAATGVDRAYLSKLETGTRVGRIEVLAALAQFYEVTIDYLYTGIGPAFPGAEENCGPPYNVEELAMIELWRTMDQSQRELVMTMLGNAVRSKTA